MLPANSEMKLLLLGLSDGFEHTQNLQSQSDIKLELMPPRSALAPEKTAMVAAADVVLLDATSLEEAERAEQVRDVVRGLQRRFPKVRIVVLTADEDPESRCAAANALAWDVVTPSQGFDALVRSLRKGWFLRRLQGMGAAPAQEEHARPEGLFLSDAEDAGIVGASAPMRRIFSLIEQVGESDVPVLVTGESGTGKELVAHAVHDRSRRCEGPFVPINCGAIPESLLESELFGHERGAFTGATRARPGRLETAQGGTLFLDEIGELAPLLQVKLLRFLEDHTVERVGGRQRIRLDVRVIAATNRNLQEAVRRGEFREDLYYRLAVFTIGIPALRERGDDVLLLARFYLRRYAAEAGKVLRDFSPEARDSLADRSWPGNVRELINRLRRAVVVAEGPEVTPEDLDLHGEGCVEDAAIQLRAARRRAEAECIQRALRRTHWNKSEAAKMLDVSRTQLYELLHRHGLSDVQGR